MRVALGNRPIARRRNLLLAVMRFGCASKHGRHAAVWNCIPRWGCTWRLFVWLWRCGAAFVFIRWKEGSCTISSSLALQVDLELAKECARTVQEMRPSDVVMLESATGAAGGPTNAELLGVGSEGLSVTAHRELTKSLWLIIARHAVQEMGDARLCVTVRLPSPRFFFRFDCCWCPCSAISIMNEANGSAGLFGDVGIAEEEPFVLAIDDILPLFPDVTVVDDFKVCAVACRLVASSWGSTLVFLRCLKQVAVLEALAQVEHQIEEARRRIDDGGSREGSMTGQLRDLRKRCVCTVHPQGRF